MLPELVVRLRQIIEGERQARITSGEIESQLLECLGRVVEAPRPELGLRHLVQLVGRRIDLRIELLLAGQRCHEQQRQRI